MHFNILAVVVCLTNADSIKGVNEVSILNITDVFTSLLNNHTNGRIDELKDKLVVINKYITDNDKLSQLLLNTTKESTLNETNFFKSLSENDHFRFILEDEPKSLYLKLKEKINRDDVLKILAEKGNVSEIVKSARRLMKGEENVERDDEKLINEVVDKIIAEKPVDHHTFDARDNESIYWDPQGELEDLQDFHQPNGRRIFKGERTTIRYYPFMVSVHVMGRFWCGGALYWHDLVLTSAACLQLMHNNRFFRENPKVLQVRIGSNHSRIGGEVIEALEVYFHPGYSPKTLRNNIAVIRLRRHLYFNYHRIPKVISISHQPRALPATAEVLLLGWGVSKMTQKMAYEPIFLQRKFLPVYPNYFCKEVYGDKFITTSMFCAGTFTTGEGACDHDAGGPAVLAGKLVGIISFGPSVCGYPNAPTVFTLVGAFADWIETINETMPGYYRGYKRTTTTTHSPLVDFFGTWESTPSSKATEPPMQPFVLSHGVPAPLAQEERAMPPPTPAPAPPRPIMRLARLRDDDTEDSGSSGDNS